MRNTQRDEEAVINANEVAEVGQGGVGDTLEVGVLDEALRRACYLVDGVEDGLGDDGVGGSKLRNLLDFGLGGARLLGVDEEEGELGECGERDHSGRLRVIVTTENHGLAACGHRVVYSAGIAMDAELANERPAIDALDLCFCLLWGLVWVRAGQGSDLKEQGGTQADADTGAAA